MNHFPHILSNGQRNIRQTAQKRPLQMCLRRIIDEGSALKLPLKGYDPLRIPLSDMGSVSGKFKRSFACILHTTNNARCTKDGYS